MFTIAAWIVGIACGVIVVVGFYAIAIDRPKHHGDAFGVCAPSRRNTLTGAYQDRQQFSYPPQADEYLPQVDEDLRQQAEEIELQQQADEIERLRVVIRQRNRTIKRLRAELEQQTGELPVMSRQPATLERFVNLEIRGR